MIDCKAVCLAYETITDDHGGLPLLTPMSEVAGRLASQQGAKYLESPQGGLGVLMGGVSGVSPADVMILRRRSCWYTSCFGSGWNGC